ncbi:hypothetical protein ACEN9D_26340 [Pseudomonas sp. CT11-2]|uniref:hypothetical protein n=1 Tax=unclassified Pseudomonas TaxID=196821 RepID=UPI00215E215C|nr:hypothetical protein [Pseudomonas sp. B21-019]UVM35461.1 hypothetical protein LOY36_12430 [Pseudomonas sp. B21-019]
MGKAVRVHVQACFDRECQLLAALAKGTYKAAMLDKGCTTFIAQPHGWHQMAERQRASEDDGLCLGLDAANLAEAFAAGNAVVTQIAQWIAEKLIKAG